MVRVSAEEFLRRLASSNVTTQETEAILLDAKISTRFRRLQLTFIDLKKNRVARLNIDDTWLEIIQKKLQDAIFNAKLPAIKIKYELNHAENIEFLKDVELSKVIELIDAVADVDTKYKYVDVEGRFLDQDTSCVIKTRNGSIIIPYTLITVQLLKEHLHGKLVKATLIAHEAANGNAIDAFLLREVEEDASTVEAGESTEPSEEEVLELPPDKQKLVDDLLKQLREQGG